MKVRFTLILARIAHAAIGNRPETLCGRLLSREVILSGLTALEAARKTDCRQCLSSFHPDVLRRLKP